jgi:hypothetical protein
MDADRFDAGHELHWRNFEVWQLAQSVGHAYDVIYERPAFSVPTYVRVDYAALLLNFAPTDISAHGFLMLSPGLSLPDTAFLSVAGAITGGNLTEAYTTQTTQPFILSAGSFRIGLLGGATGTSASVITGTVAVSYAPIPTLSLLS